jgi:putative membrane protein
VKVSFVLAALVAASPAVALTDPEIADVALTAHEIDIARGKLALSKTKNEEIKQFAQQMVDDHGAGVKEAVALATRLGVKPEKNGISKGLRDGAKRATARLKKESGAKFDKDYIDTEAQYHQAVIDAVRNTLIPNAQNKDLKQLLTDAVPTLEGHLKHAQNLQQRPGGHASK